MEFKTKRLTFRPLKTEDANTIQEILTGDVTATMIGLPYTSDPESVEKWVSLSEKTTQFNHFGIISNETSQLIGGVTIEIDKKHQLAQIGGWLGKSFWAKGYATEGASKIMEMCFDEFGANKLYCAYIAGNIGSRKVMEKIGLIEEGTLKQHVRINGDFKDLTFFRLLKEEYQVLKMHKDALET